MNRTEVLRESQRWLDIISSTQISDEEKQRIITETAENFNSYYNRGYLEYRKSMVEMRDEPALEWEGQGSLLYDLTGRRFIDCLGGYGIYSAGIRHPKIVKAVEDLVESGLGEAHDRFTGRKRRLPLTPRRRLAKYPMGAHSPDTRPDLAKLTLWWSLTMIMGACRTGWFGLRSGMRGERNGE